MKTLSFASVVLAGALLGGVAMAGDDCTDPVADWAYRKIAAKLEQYVWRIHRIKVDDGCYEVRGIDGNGNKFKAEYAPASLRIHKLEINFHQSGDISDYLRDQNASAPRSQSQLNKLSSQIIRRITMNKAVLQSV